MSERMFACGLCRKKWWRIGNYSRCYGCRQVLSALPRDKEYGVGVHNCQCGKQFYGRTRANVKSRCYKCNTMCLPRIIPNKDTLNRKSENTHSCKMCNGKGNCPNFNPIIYTSTTVGGHDDNDYYDQDDEYDDDYYDEHDDERDDDCDSQDGDDYYDEHDDDCDSQDGDDYYDDDDGNDEGDDDYYDNCDGDYDNQDGDEYYDDNDGNNEGDDDYYDERDDDYYDDDYGNDDGDYDQWYERQYDNGDRDSDCDDDDD